MTSGAIQLVAAVSIVLSSLPCFGQTDVSSSDNAAESSTTTGDAGVQSKPTNQLSADADLFVQSSFDLENGAKRFATLVGQRGDVWRKAAEAGDPDGLFLWGVCHHLGVGAPADGERSARMFIRATALGSAHAQVMTGIIAENVDKKLALAMYEKAASQGLAWAHYRLGITFAKGKLVDEDQARAYEHIKSAAEKGLAAAQTDAAMRCEQGNGTPRDLVQAFDWYRRAAEQGDAVGQYKLGIVYFFGNGAEIDLKQAQNWLAKSSDQGHVMAEFCLAKAADQLIKLNGGIESLSSEEQHGINADRRRLESSLLAGNARDAFFGKRRDARFRDWRRAALADSPAGQFLYAMSIKLNPAKFGAVAAHVLWLERAANHGFAPAQAQLAMFYGGGQFVPKDAEKAIHWCRKAAEQGWAPAECALGGYYAKGIGVEQDFDESVRWLRKAADQGFALAETNLGRRYKYGQGVERDFEESVRWFRKAANKGHAEAQCNLALCYEQGEGVIEDGSTAIAQCHLLLRNGRG